MVAVRTLFVALLTASVSALNNHHDATTASHEFAAIVARDALAMAQRELSLYPPTFEASDLKKRLAKSKGCKNKDVKAQAPAAASPTPIVLKDSSNDKKKKKKKKSTTTTKKSKPTTTKKTKSTSTKKAAKPTPTKKGSGNVKAAGSSVLNAQHSGDGTFYTPGLGACGETNSENDMIAAVGHGLFDSFPGATANPNNNPICGRSVTATFNGKSVTVKLVDRCGGCDQAEALDFSPAAFRKLANLDVGRLHGVTWKFN